MDLNSLSNEELAKIAGIELPSQPMAAPAQQDLNSLSNEELAQIAGIELPKPAQSGALLASNTLMAPLQGAGFNFADEAVAGAQTGIEKVSDAMGDYLVNPARSLFGYEPIEFQRSKGYDANLADINKDYQQYRTERPKEALALELGGALLTPGAALKGSGALGTIAKMGAYGAAQSGLAGLGEGQGLEDRANKAIDYAGVGGALGGAIPVVAKGAGALGDLAKWLGLGKASNIGEKQASKALQEIVSPDDIAKIKAAPTDEVGAMRTLAEAAQSPQLAREQQRLMDVSGDAMNANNVNQLARNDALKDMLTSISDQPVREVAEAGDEIRRALDPVQKGWIEEIEKSAISRDTLSKVPVSKMGDRADDIIFNNFASGDVPKDIKKISEDIKRSIDPETLKRFGYDANEVAGMSRITNRVKPYRYIDDVRLRLIQIQTDAAAAGQKQTLKAATELKRLIDSSVKEAGDKGLMTPSEVSRHFDSNKKWEEYFKVYGGDKNVGAVTSRFGEKGDYTMMADQVVERIWKGRRTDAEDLIKATRGDEEALGAIRGAIRDKILKQAFPAESDKIANNATLKNLSKIKEALNVEVKGIRLFDKDHVNAIEKVFEETQYLSTARKGQSALMKSSSGGQPTTAARLLAADDGAIVGFLEKHSNKIINALAGGAAVGTYNSNFSTGSMLGYGGAFLGALALKGRSGAISKAYRTALQKALIEDRDFAIKLLERPTQSAIGKALEYLTPAAARIAPKAFGIDSDDDTQFQAPQGASSYQSATQTDPKPYNQEQKLSRSSDSPSVSSPLSDTQFQAPQGAFSNYISPKTATTQFLSDQTQLPTKDSVPSVSSPLQDIAYNLNASQPKDIKRFISQQPKLIQAMIKQESGGKINAKSPAGAIGLMQLMPATARELGVNPLDPIENVEGGTRYIRQMFEQFDSPYLAIAAYNAGPGNVQKAIRKAGTEDWTQVRRFLPKETQNYVPSVLRNLANLRTA